jgi:predicted dehydrogenase
MKKKVGIIGFGRMGQIRLEVIRKLDIFEVVSIYDPYSTKKNRLFVNSLDDLIDNKNIEIIFICTPNYLNKKLTIESLKKEKHVFCEKPPGLNAKDIENVIIAENKYKKTLMYGFNHRHHDSIQKIKQIVDKKEFGRILWMRGRYGKSVETDFYKNWRSKKEYSGGGILIDQGIHMLDIFLYLAGDFDKIQATVSNLYWDLDIEDNVFAVLQNSKNKIAASLHSTMTQWRNLFSLEVFFEKGYVVLNGLNTSSKSYGEEVLNIAKNRSLAPAAICEEEENIHFKIDNSWEKEIIEFNKSIIKNTKPIIGNSLEALQLMKVIDEIYKFR